jgi:LysR family hydrogen peroxide-inducible transcriptional activator
MARPESSLRQLRCLIALAEAQSFRAAAARTGISQPSFSAQIRNLEEALGLSLVERRAGGAALTAIGRETLLRAYAVVDAARGLEEFASAAHASLSGRLRLGVSPTIGPYLLPHVVGRLHRRHPDMRLLIREDAPAALSRQLVEGDHDAVIAQAPLREDGLTTTPLFRERLLLIVAADHPLARAGTVSPEHLAGLEVLTLDPRFELRTQVQALCETFGAKLSRDYEGSSLDALRLMTGMNAGVAFVPELYARSEVRPGGDVVALALRGRALHRLITLAWRRSLPETSALERLGALSREAFAALTGAAL